VLISKLPYWTTVGVLRCASIVRAGQVVPLALML